MTDRVGQQLGNYSLIRLLGEGGFAEVYLGEHIYLKTQGAIKVLQMRLASEDREGFLEEARTIAGLKHPHIIRVLDFGIEAGTPFLVMDYAANGTLRKRHPKNAPLQLVTILNYVKQVAPALQYAHERKLMHRDVKPENLLLGEDNEVLLSDFGIALVTQSSRYQSTQEVVGTAAYMAPEQFQGKPRPASDQYALGIIVYEWLCGDRPFHGTFSELYSQHLFVPPPPLREKVPTILPAVEQVVLTALEKDPHKRFASVQAFANALETACCEVLAHSTPDSDALTELRSDRNPSARETIQLEALNQATATPGSMRPPLVTSDTLLKSETSGHRPATNGPLTPLPQMLPSSVTHPVLPLPPTKQHRRRNVIVVSISLLLLVALLLGFVLSRSLASRTPTLSSTSLVATNIPTNSPTITPTPQTVQRQLTSVKTASQSVNATGQGQTGGKHATGTVEFQNTAPIHIAAGTVLTNGDGCTGQGLQITLNNNVDIPYNQASAYVSITVVQVGAGGNIQDCGTAYFAFHLCNPSCYSSNLAWIVFDINGGFSGGIDPQAYTYVQQSDIDNAASPLTSSTTSQAQADIQNQLRSNEHLVGTPQCNSNTSSDHAAGDHASTVTVTVTTTCTATAST